MNPSGGYTFGVLVICGLAALAALVTIFTWACAQSDALRGDPTAVTEAPASTLPSGSRVTTLPGWGSDPEPPALTPPGKRAS